MLITLNVKLEELKLILKHAEENAEIVLDMDDAEDELIKHVNAKRTLAIVKSLRSQLD